MRENDGDDGDHNDDDGVYFLMRLWQNRTLSVYKEYCIIRTSPWR